MFKSLLRKTDSIQISATIVLSLMMGSLSCAPKASDDESVAGACMASGDIVVSNSGSDAVLVLDSLGNYKRIAYNLVNTAEAPYGLAWSQDSSELIVAVDGADRVVAVSAADCSVRNIVQDTNLTGNIRGVTRLVSGDVLVIETSNIERFTWQGIRIATGGWPRALQTTGTGLDALSNGGFVHCSTGTDVVRTYDSTGVQVATVSSGIAATTDAADCLELADGRIAAVWSGTTDTVRIYPAGLGTHDVSFSNVSLLSTPVGIAERSNGNLLVLDRLLNWIVEIDNAGNLVGTLGDGVLSTPEYILVVP